MSTYRLYREARDTAWRALLRLPEGEPLKEKLLIPWPGKVNKLTLLDIELPMRFERVTDGLLVDIPNIFVGVNPIAPVFRMEE